ncbi:MAG: DUF4097 family beta strand repeat-containing protein [Emergencia timonensis]|uniref:DUF4097 family beta strand repeat-containing protein n=1 Tax=Emergencia timonensis TaxID=1776384 RepID=UPI000832D87A|nr:DUF4097 family beta strand repeat-containing protein [Emergencia timonensis]
MKKSTKIILMISICLISVGIVLSAIGRFAGASPRHILFDGLWNASFRYGDDFDNDFEENNTYHVSDASINSIDIDWISGRVTVIPYDGDDIVIREKSKGKIDEENCLRYRISGDTLEINYFLQTAEFNFTGSINYSKQLEIKVPRALAKSLDELNFDAVSADLNIRDLHIASLDVDTTSGNLLGKNIEAKYVNMGTVSGDMKVTYTSCPKELNMDSTSGDCTISLPKGSSVTAELDSVSGDFSSEFSTRYEEEDVYIIGSGECEFSVSTVSGDFVINKGAK